MLPITMPPAMFSAWASGAATGLGLFAVVGAQSAFILRQGIMRSHLAAILAVCAAIDAVFIFASVLGLQAMTEWLPWLTGAVLWFGVAFLLWYAWQSARRALRPQGGLHLARQAVPSRRAALLAAVGFSLLNPHFWLDMMVVGSIAQNFQEEKLGFAAGTLTASVLWLFVLGVGSRLFAPLFTDARAWRVLDGLIAVVMAFLALRLAAAN
ncbi:LysE/ArgO family amino acid transporter [Parapusillimonas granuli]|uniref:LysE family transporter n=1 Tax=Parapusillimonas granuli TaxID=380911 RepID=A0A853G3C5_9BURK|nr:LysE family transporter [Parapusillimonas granuli]MBB5214586.1 L-lysine exporter family protein LysE/ArgO [Parapusillimonas granuli]MEB2398165.1 LysE family transporter [Alcaligenaceae bacterium]NYT49006.1 LysE family transporter [Parapusillimonas granuli]